MEIRIKLLSYTLYWLYTCSIKLCEHLLVDLIHTCDKRIILLIIRYCCKTSLEIVDYRKDFLNYCLCSHVKHLGFFLLTSLAEVLELCHLSFQTVVKFFYLLILLVFFLFLEEAFLFI